MTFAVILITAVYLLGVAALVGLALIFLDTD